MHTPSTPVTRTVPRTFDRFALRLLIGMALVLGAPGYLFSQGGNLGGFGTLGGVEPTAQYPAPEYYYALDIYRTGDLLSALDAFEIALRSGRRDIRGRWIDSIPALAMLAECHWHLGNLPTARDYCDQVFQIAINNRGWLGRIDWQTVMHQNAQRARAPGLWSEANAINLVPISDQVMFLSGQPLTENAIRRGGEIQEMNIRPMDIVEIVRGITLASYRRRVILGPLSDQDPLSTGLLESTKYPKGLQIPLARNLIGAMRTSGRFTNYEDQRTVEEAAQYGLFGNSAHPLSSLVMLCQLSAMVGAERVDGLPSLAVRAVHVAAALEQPEFIGEAMQLAAACANAQQAPMVRQAANTVAQALFRDSPLATMHCLIAGADASVTAGDLDSAVTMLTQAQTLGSRRDVNLPRLSAYGAYVAARLAAAQGSSVGITQASDFDEAINRMSGFALNHRIRSNKLVSMPRVYQFNLIQQSVGKNIGADTSDRLLKAYCMDPPIDVWRRDAVDALASVMMDRSLAHFTRVNLAGSGGYAEPLLLASDMMLSSRFQQRLPLGGRIAQLRTLAWVDDSVLDKKTVEWRNKLGRPMAELRAAAADPAQAGNLEAKACALAVARITLPQTLPPLLSEERPVAKLPTRTGLLTFTASGNRLFATISTNGKTSMWTVAGGSRLSAEIGRLLKAIGVGKTRGKRIPEDDSWREAAVDLRRHLIPDDAVLSEDQFDELIIVPDGSLWYLPFEILPTQEKDSDLLGDKIAIRYMPTPGMALQSLAPPPASRVVGLCADLFFAPRDPEQNEAMIQSIMDVMNDPMRLPQSNQTPTSLLGDAIGHLVVAAPRSINPQNPLIMSPAPYDQDTAAGTLAAWMRFPTPSPRNVVLFGTRTPVGVGQMGTGDELFTALCGLYASGVRSVLLSRWAVGGESSAIALRELVQELPFIGLGSAWNRARMVLRRSELDPAAEPLLIQSEHDMEGLTGDQPLFWSGYLMSAPHLPEVSAAE